MDPDEIVEQELLNGGSVVVVDLLSDLLDFCVIVVEFKWESKGIY